MSDTKLVELAKYYCRHYHEGQVRKGNGEPYSNHPFEVLEILKRFNYADEITSCIALLHDVVEDTEVILGEIKEKFGYEIANGVFILSKNTLTQNSRAAIKSNALFSEKHFTDDELYKLRLSFARRLIKQVKLADLIHNTQDLESLCDAGIRKKINETTKFYIPMGLLVAPLMAKELQDNIDKFLQKNPSFKI